ncbi:hypothetical protein, partial [Edaphosphingomonas haloaromaticamans]|uniref:hypothetical protein n=1 Tax=Edaphosphingomonas haloaromaticamans TaxID=653954 RepID=UPI001C2F1449
MTDLPFLIPAAAAALSDSLEIAVNYLLNMKNHPPRFGGPTVLPRMKGGPMGIGPSWAGASGPGRRRRPPIQEGR